jgi:hypothetical protein
MHSITHIEVIGLGLEVRGLGLGLDGMRSMTPRGVRVRVKVRVKG